MSTHPVEYSKTNMALTTVHKEIEFGVGDKIKVFQRIREGQKDRVQSFEGIVISVRGESENKSFTVRKIGAGAVGIERIFPVASPTIEKIEVARRGTKGVRHAKLYYIRGLAKREIEKIYSRAARKSVTKAQVPKEKKSRAKVRKTSVKTA